MYIAGASIDHHPMMAFACFHINQATRLLQDTVMRPSVADDIESYSTLIWERPVRAALTMLYEQPGAAERLFPLDQPPPHQMRLLGLRLALNRLVDHTIMYLILNKAFAVAFKNEWRDLAWRLVEDNISFDTMGLLEPLHPNLQAHLDRLHVEWEAEWEAKWAARWAARMAEESMTVERGEEEEGGEESMKKLEKGMRKEPVATNPLATNPLASYAAAPTDAAPTNAKVTDAATTTHAADLAMSSTEGTKVRVDDPHEQKLARAAEKKKRLRANLKANKKAQKLAARLIKEGMASGEKDGSQGSASQPSETDGSQGGASHPSEADGSKGGNSQPSETDGSQKSASRRSETETSSGVDAEGSLVRHVPLNPKAPVFVCRQGSDEENMIETGQDEPGQDETDQDEKDLTAEATHATAA